jgi:DNA repair exonuclease SbcCD nuclease subunit
VKILHTSDWHADWVTAGVPRFDDVRAVAMETAREAVRQRVDLYAFTGDLADPDDPVAVLRAVGLALEIATFLARAGITSAWMPGNHDVVEDGSGLTTLSPLRRLGIPEVLVLEEPEAFDWPTGEVGFLALPFTPLSRDYDPKAALGRFLVKEAPLARTSVVLSHLSFPGLQIGEESTEMRRGRDVEFPVHLLAPGVVVLQGHHHRRTIRRAQEHPELHGASLYVPGSAVRLTHGEEDLRPGYLIVEV